MPLDEHSDPLWTATERLPLSELADPDDVAAAALLLLAGDDGFTTGTREWEHASFQAKATDAERRSRQAIRTSQRQAEDIIADANAKADRLRNDVERELASLTARRDAINAQLTSVHGTLITLTGGAVTAASLPIDDYFTPVKTDPAFAWRCSLREQRHEHSVSIVQPHPPHLEQPSRPIAPDARSSHGSGRDIQARSAVPRALDALAAVAQYHHGGTGPGLPYPVRPERQGAPGFDRRALTASCGPRRRGRPFLPEERGGGTADGPPWPGCPWSLLRAPARAVDLRGLRICQGHAMCPEALLAEFVPKNTE
ncbi:hypothetical protein TR51_00050 [Kitasatospora griseola]|uniref:Uncharacterized protein n=1 Tax=Kitasatospora griseola TaxID=2064 RepID=A0A0D0Q563_KITGR|nr:hypothetical protein TR51_00050 [Kitasatospora griseola]